MKKFCECNSKWITGLCFDTRGLCVQITLSSRHTNDFPEICPQCQFYKWYNPQYENMMYDLKGMNS